jgi:hypothetical protein
MPGCEFIIFMTKGGFAAFFKKITIHGVNGWIGMEIAQVIINLIL